MRSVVIANGDIKEYSFIRSLLSPNDFLLCADGAIRHFINMNIYPDIWIGDFDSCTYEQVCKSNPDLLKVKTLTLNPVKDYTDTQAACDVAISHGSDEILILAAVGSRIDHTLSTIHLLEYLNNREIKASIVTENNCITLLTSFYEFSSQWKYISLIPLDEYVDIIKTTGLKYNLENFRLLRENSLGVSNEFVSNEASIKIKNGKLLVIQSRD